MEEYLKTMNCGNVKEKKKTYESIFRIGGEPILPPLMTAEKRRQMQWYRERAIKLEKKLDRQFKKLQYYSKDSTSQVPSNKSPRSLLNSSFSTDDSPPSPFPIELNCDFGMHSQTFEESLQRLSTMLNKRDDDFSSPRSRHLVNCSTTTDSDYLQRTSSERTLKERMERLQKSDTFIYDHVSNSVLIPLGIALDQESVEEECEQTQPDNRDSQPGTPTEDDSPQLDLQVFMASPRQQIPAICVDPPTPLHDTCCFSEAASEDAFLPSSRSADSDKELTAMGGSIADAELTSTSSSQNSEHLHTHQKLTNITGKIIQFERLLANGSEESLEPPLLTPRRSATSPSLKSDSESSPLNSLSVSESSNGGNLGLVRSNSFTLDYPSKALLDHMRLQDLQNSVNSTPSKRVGMPSARATRDTVESKAKRVQKVNLKARQPQPPQRNSTERTLAKPLSRVTLNPGASPYATRSTTQLKKRSPYEPRSVGKNSRQSRGTAPGTMPTRQVKAKSSAPSMVCSAQKSGSDSAHSTFSANVDLLCGLADEQRQRILNLISFQQEEQKRLQETFDNQQQSLLEELSSKMSKAQLTKLRSSRSMPAQDERSLSSVRYKVNSANQKNHYNHKNQKNNNSDSSGESSPVGGVDSANAYDYQSLDESSSSTMTASVVQNGRGPTPRRRLFSNETKAQGQGKTTAGGGLKTSGSMTSSPNQRGIQDLVLDVEQNMTTSAEQEDTDSEDSQSSQLEAQEQHVPQDQEQQLAEKREADRRAAAASIINAYTRGFLVRRLFQTEQIQRIVQTIRDTLIFVLNLHMETQTNPEEANTPANVKLKARLLQQLCSASRALHLVLFQTTIKERMEIIGRDRKRIKTKLLSMNRKRYGVK